jgi:hypothetical protein
MPERDRSPHSKVEKVVLLDDRLRCRGSRPSASGEFGFLVRSWSRDS